MLAEFEGAGRAVCAGQIGPIHDSISVGSAHERRKLFDRHVLAEDFCQRGLLERVVSAGLGVDYIWVFAC